MFFYRRGKHRMLHQDERLDLITEKWNLFRAQHIEFSLHTKVTKIINKTHVHLAYFADQNKMLLLPKDTYPSILSIPTGSLLMIISVLQYNEKSKFDPSEELCKVSPPPRFSPDSLPASPRPAKHNVDVRGSYNKENVPKHQQRVL